MTFSKMQSLVTLSTMASVSAFGGVAVPETLRISGQTSISTPPTPIQRNNRASSSSSLSAIIYGWDGEDDTDENGKSSTFKQDFQSEVGIGQCSPVGTAVADRLTYDADKMGSLARLAVAFSPPERALTLADIEKVEVICVREDHIEIQAIVCEDGGCVSLAVPVKFPKSCQADSEWLEGCVMRNLEALDEQAEAALLIQEESDDDPLDLDELCQLNSKIDYPSWWIPPECNAEMVTHCDTVRRLLNEDEFSEEVGALAQDVLNGWQGGGEVYSVKNARVAVVGPAGICLKVRAQYQIKDEDGDKPIHVLDVMYPFGGTPMNDVASLRAAVLGAIAAAEGRQP
jgi:hypothetical protein